LFLILGCASWHRLTLRSAEAAYNCNLREETLKYLDKDLQSLFEILSKFQETLSIDHQNLEMTQHLTLSSIAKTKFLKYYLKKF
jgi:DNA polymerase type B, organellar and viral